jgi:hypothetical protein
MRIRSRRKRAQLVATTLRASESFTATPASASDADRRMKEKMMFGKLIPTAMVGLSLAVVGACGASGSKESASQVRSSPSISASVAAIGRGCNLLTEVEAETVLGGPVMLADAPVADGIWCSWRSAGQASITALELELAPGEDRFDEAMDQADRGDGLHDTHPALGPLGFTTDDGQTKTVAWVVDHQTVVLSLTAGDLTTEDLVVLARAVNTRLGA